MYGKMWELNVNDTWDFYFDKVGVDVLRELELKSERVAWDTEKLFHSVFNQWIYG